jgi:hypothetical protein
MTNIDNIDVEELIKVLEDMISERIPIYQGCHLLLGNV